MPARATPRHRDRATGGVGRRSAGAVQVAALADTEGAGREAGDADRLGEGEPRRTFTSGLVGAEPAVGRVADGVPHRVDRLAALGNALVPQIAEWIGRRILEYERAAGSRREPVS